MTTSQFSRFCLFFFFFVWCALDSFFLIFFRQITQSQYIAQNTEWSAKIIQWNAKYGEWSGKHGEWSGKHAEWSGKNAEWSDMHCEWLSVGNMELACCTGRRDVCRAWNATWAELKDHGNLRSDIHPIRCAVIDGALTNTILRAVTWHARWGMCARRKARPQQAHATEHEIQGMCREWSGTLFLSSVARAPRTKTLHVGDNPARRAHVPPHA